MLFTDAGDVMNRYMTLVMTCVLCNGGTRWHSWLRLWVQFPMVSLEFSLI